jgi:hypothetical protein
MTAAELRKSLVKLAQPRGDDTSPEMRRLELLAAERDVSRFLSGKHRPSPRAAAKLAEIIVREGAHHEQVGGAYEADPSGFELACRNALQRLRYRLGRAVSRVLP